MSRSRSRISRVLALLALATVVAGVVHSRTSRAPLYTFHHENVLGTSLEIKISAPTQAAAERAEAAALAEFDRLSKILSAWDNTSEFSHWVKTRSQPVPVSAELMEVLRLFDQWRENTNGALNAAAAAGSNLWRDAARNGVEPTSSQLRQAAATMQTAHWVLDNQTRTATHLDGTPLVLASFTKTYITNRAAKAALAAEPSASGIVLNAGGDIVARGDATEIVGIRDPKADAENDPLLGQVALREGAIATSGSYRRGVDIKGRHYSHIIDPRTAQPAAEVLSSTVQHPDPVTAGALATAFSVLEPNESAALAAKVKNVEYLIVKRDGVLIASNGWRHMALPLAPAVMAPPAPNEWNTGLELAIQVALARVDDPRYRRPYVAVWIEDKDKFPVRTIALWYEKPRWLPDLKAWYRDDRLRAMAEGTEITSTVSSATRPPGRYTLKWDGKDNAGKLVKAGKYTVCIEAAREHGTYQVIRQDLEFTGVPKQVQLPGNTEIESVSLDYRKAAR